MSKKTWVNYTKLRELLDFGTVLQHYGIEHDAAKNQIKIVCPFHDDRTPSCSVNVAESMFQCFGCGAKGNALEFVTRMEDGDPNDKEALYRGAIASIEILGMSPDDFKKGSKLSSKPTNEVNSSSSTNSSKEQRTKQTEPKSEGKKPEVNEVLDLNLTLDSEHPYLIEVRGLDEATITKFGLGFCARGIMKNRIAIPIHSLQGDLVAYAGRWADDDIPEGTPRYKLPATFHKSLELFNIHRAKEFGKRHLVIVEGYWSTIRLHNAGIPTVALMGRSVSTEQATLVVEAGFRFVTLLLDGDDEGRAAIPEALNVLGRQVYARAAELPDGIKPDTMPEEKLDELR